MYKIKHPNKKNSSPLMMIIPKGDTLISILTSPKAVLSKLKSNGRDIKKLYKNNSN